MNDILIMMRKILSGFILMVALLAANAGFSQSVKKVKIEELESYIKKQRPSTYRKFLGHLVRTLCKRNSMDASGSGKTARQKSGACFGKP